MNDTEDLLSKWGPGLLSWPLPLAAYCWLATAAPEVMRSAAGFLAGTASAALASVLLLALISKALGVYRRDERGAPRVDPQRQGIFAAQTGLVVAVVVFPRLGIQQPWWLYLLALVVAGAAGSAAMRLIAGRAAASQAPDAPQTPQAAPRSAKAQPRIAPRWARRGATICMTLGAIAILRLLLGGESYFLWGGLALLVGGALLPSLAVLLGGGRPPGA